MRFIHTADWQIGKPYGSIADADRRAAARRARIDAIGRIAEHVRHSQAAFVLVAGDLFDSIHPDRSTVRAACAALGRIPCPVVVIPGNHGHGGPGSFWHQPYFRDALQEYAGNVIVALDGSPISLSGAVVFPCPLLRQRDNADVFSALRDVDAFSAVPADAARIVLAHGSVQAFGSAADAVADFDGAAAAVGNLLDLDALPAADLDYIALGDWHGMRQVHAKAWYSGTHEPDRFPKNDDYVSGRVLLVAAERGAAPVVQPLETGLLRWHSLELTLVGDDAVDRITADLQKLLGGRVLQDMLALRVTGALSFAQRAALDALLERLRETVLRLDLDDAVVVEPTSQDLALLTARRSDPMTARVAARLIDELHAGGDAAETARFALRELHLAVTQASEESA
jgi:DNA repair exonuclease SbcCD nuclease subunit